MRLVVVRFAGHVIVETVSSVRVLETFHPPTFYVPLEDVDVAFLSPSRRQTVCEFKGTASHWDLVSEHTISPDAAWGYQEPNVGYGNLSDMISFYPGRVDACTVDGELVVPQEGGFYGGWITSDVTGPFKGSVGTTGW